MSAETQSTRTDNALCIVNKLERIDSENTSRESEADEERSLESEEDPGSSDSEKKMGYMSLDVTMCRYEGELQSGR